MRSDSKSKAKEGFAPLKQDEDSIFNDEPAGAVGGGNSAAKKKAEAEAAAKKAAAKMKKKRIY